MGEHVDRFITGANSIRKSARLRLKIIVLLRETFKQGFANQQPAGLYFGLSCRKRSMPS